MNYCKKCGTKLKEGAEVCPRCKTNQKELEEKIAAYELEQAEKKKKRRIRNRIIAACCAAVVIIAAGITAFILTRPEDIDLTDYLVVEYVGEDGEAVAEFSFDYEAFYEYYGDRISFVDESEFEDMIELLGIDANEYAAQYLFETYVSGTVSPEDGLSVGDYVSFIWDVDEDGIEEIFGISVVYEDQILYVSELTEADEDEDEDSDDEDADSDEDEDADSDDEDADSEDEDTDSEEEDTDSDDADADSDSDDTQEDTDSEEETDE